MDNRLKFQRLEMLVQVRRRAAYGKSGQPLPPRDDGEPLSGIN